MISLWHAGRFRGLQTDLGYGQVRDRVGIWHCLSCRGLIFIGPYIGDLGVGGMGSRGHLGSQRRPPSSVGAYLLPLRGTATAW